MHVCIPLLNIPLLTLFLWGFGWSMGAGWYRWRYCISVCLVNDFTEQLIFVWKRTLMTHVEMCAVSKAWFSFFVCFINRFTSLYLLCVLYVVHFHNILQPLLRRSRVFLACYFFPPVCHHVSTKRSQYLTLMSQGYALLYTLLHQPQLHWSCLGVFY